MNDKRQIIQKKMRKRNEHADTHIEKDNFYRVDTLGIEVGLGPTS